MEPAVAQASVVVKLAMLPQLHEEEFDPARTQNSAQQAIPRLAAESWRLPN